MAEGIRLTFPSDWQAINLTQGQLDDYVAALQKNPGGVEMAKIVRAASASGMVKMFVFDPKGSEPGFMNNANLVVTPGVGNATLDQALEASRRQILAMNMDATTSKVTFPAGEFGRLESHLTAAVGKPYVAIGYLQPYEGSLDVVTFSCTPDQVTEFDAKAQQVMNSFRRG